MYVLRSHVIAHYVCMVDIKENVIVSPVKENLEEAVWLYSRVWLYSSAFTRASRPSPPWDRK